MVNGPEIKARRIAAMMTMDDLAQRAGFLTPSGRPSRQRVYDIETGRRADITADTLWAIAKALPHCRMEDLMMDAPPPKRKPKRSKRSPK